MSAQQYTVNDYTLETLLNWIKNDDIAIPEIQRPFVWKPIKVRDFIDSLYFGYPVGYLITWRAPDVRLRNGGRSEGERILIDGQQRVIAIRAALQGHPVVNKNYRMTRIIIAFNPREERFAVADAANRKNPEWVHDIATVFAPGARMRLLVDEYCELNQHVDKYEIDERMERLKDILHNTLGFIELAPGLSMETVAEIFVRINSKGVSLNEADFAMSKMAATEQYDGHRLRKCIDYFCYLAIDPGAYGKLVRDDDFANSDYFRRMEWLKDWRNDLYAPSYTDMLRVAFASEFKRGRLADLVALLSGRNFDTRTFDEAIAEESFFKFKDGVMNYMKKNHFENFLMILNSAGFVNSSMIKSKNAVNFAYILYLTLHAQRPNVGNIETLVRRWFVMSVLTARYSGSTETTLDADIRHIDEQGAPQYLDAIEREELSDVFWEASLPRSMNTSVASSSYFNLFLASQVMARDKGFLSPNLSVHELLKGQSDIHHIFPRRYLQNHGLAKDRYNQIANYVVMQKEFNIAIGDKPPEKYFSELNQKRADGRPRYGGITDSNQLQENLVAHCLPEGMESQTVENYDAFLERRRKLMAAKIRDYYNAL